MKRLSSTIYQAVMLTVTFGWLFCLELDASAQPGSLGAWSATSSLPYPVDSPAAVALNGYIYVFGGYANPQGVTPYLDNSVHTAAVNSDGSLQSWQTTTPFSTGRRLHAVALDSANSRVYVIGGCVTTSSLNGVNDVQYAHLSAGGVSAWTSTTPLPAGISGHSALCYDGYLYVFRGNDQFGGAAQGYYYAPISPFDGSIGTWRQGTLSFPVRRYFGTFAYNDHFYLIGGNNGSSTAFNNVYDTRVPQRSSLPYLQMNETEVWNDTTPFQNARWLQGTANANGFAYITGGQTTAGSPPDRSDAQYAQILPDGSVGLWFTTASLPTTLANHACVISGSHIYVLGGDKGVGFGFQQVASVLYSSILSSFDTTPPVTQISPPPGQQSSSTLNVILMASDLGGSGVSSIRYTTDNSDPASSGTAVTVNSATANFSVSVPITVKFFAKDAAGNAEQTQTANYSPAQNAPPNAVKFRWPTSGPITQDFYDDFDGLQSAVFWDENNIAHNWKKGDINVFVTKSRTHSSGVPGGGYLHRGIDIAPPAGSDVHPALSGRATRYDWNGTLGDFYGNHIVIDHGNGYYTLYAHLQTGFAGKLSQIQNHQSVDVAMSDIIGHVGATGAATGPHLHFEIRHSSDAVDYAQQTHFIPVPQAPNPLSVVVGAAIPFNYPGLGGTSLSLQLVNSGGLNDVASTSPTISGNGSLVGFRNSPVFHMVDSITELLQQENVDGNQTAGNGGLFTPVFSADGSIKAFASDNANLVANDTNGVPDVFVWTQTNGVTQRISVSSAGDQANGASYDVGMSADGGYVVFTSVANNLVANDTNQATDIFIRDLQTNQTLIVSVNSNGIEGNGPSYSPSISADGRYVAFVSEATNLVAGDTNGVADIFVRDLQVNTITLVSKTWNGSLANGASRQPSISGDGRYIAYESDASNLVPNDTNGFADVFLYDSVLGTVQELSVGLNGQQGNGNSHEPRISSYGLRIAFTSEASNLAANDTNGLPDVFLVSFAALPVLNVSLAGNNIFLSWPTNSAIFNLESTTNLNSPVVWLPVSPAPTIINDQNFVTNPISGSAKFYRLKN